jgi:YD repeat-containing protein
VHERFQPLNLSSGLAYLVLADGGQVEFLATLHHSCDDVGCTSWWSYQATAIIDPNGLRTAFTYNADGTLSRITEPGGRWLQIIYTAGRISEVQAGYTIGSTTTLTQIVDYVYTTFAGYTVLWRADYNDGTSASYYYQNSNVSPYTGFPLIQTCNDVRYPGPMKLIAYDLSRTGSTGNFRRSGIGLTRPSSSATTLPHTRKHGGMAKPAPSLTVRQTKAVLRFRCLTSWRATRILRPPVRL